jgi:hypothetical protein
MAVDTGAVAAEINGVNSDARVQRVENQIVVQVGPINATFAAVDSSGDAATLDNDGNVRLNPGDAVRINANGFEPGSIVELWLFSTPVRLGEVVVPSDGSVTGDFAIPEDAEDGAHRIAIIARTSEGEAATLAMGILVGADNDSGTVSIWLIAPPIALAVMMALVLPATRRRRSVKPDS